MGHVKSKIKRIAAFASAIAFVLLQGCAPKEAIDIIEPVPKGDLVFIKDGENTHEVRITDDGILGYYLDGKYQGQTHWNTSDGEADTSVLEQDILVFPEINENAIFNTDEAEVVVDNVYRASLRESAAFLKDTFKDSEILFQANTPLFIEVYAQKDETITRVIATEQYLIVASLDEVPEFNLENYLYIN